MKKAKARQRREDLAGMRAIVLREFAALMEHLATYRTRIFHYTSNRANDEAGKTTRRKNK